MPNAPQPANIDTPVLIVGGGPVGLALACELGWRGIACTLIEQGDGVVTSPKMNEVNVRSMEFCRRWGIVEDIDACPFPAEYPLDSAFVTSLFGYEMSRVHRPARTDEKPESYGPVRMQVCSQHWFDPILQKRVRSFPHVSLRYHTRFEDFAEKDDGVSARITTTDTGETETITCRYLIGCDGATSRMRDQLGIKLGGEGTIGNSISLFFRAQDLLAECGQKHATFYLCVDDGGAWGSLRVIEPDRGMWRVMIDNVADDITEDTIDRDGYLERALGRPYPVQWIGHTIWRRRSALAESYGKGRVWLAGDSVHQLSPTGAMGMNSGLADAVDLGWKLEAMINGWGGTNLLDSYDAERRPTGARAVRMATRFYKNNIKFDAGGNLEEDSDAGAHRRAAVGEKLLANIGGEFRTVGLQIGYRYEGSPIILADGTPEGPDEPEAYHPTARPGSRAPHTWLDDGRSTLDLFGREFILLRLGPNPPDATQITNAASERNVPLKVVTLTEPEAYDVYERQLILVRPDGHVAWRADTSPLNPLTLIDTVRGA